MQKSALITGITGQDGSYLAEFLIQKGYNVYGLVRDSHSVNREILSSSLVNVELIEGDLQNEESLRRAVSQSVPDEIYNLAAHANIAKSWDESTTVIDINSLGFARLLNVIRGSKREPKIFQASSCQIFGLANKSPQDETTEIRPQNPYGCSKAFSQFLSKSFRDSHNMFISNGILYNHDSERRGLQFLTRKVANGVAKIKLGIEKELILGNLQSERDWGYAKDFVKAMWLMLQQDKPDDFIIATGESHTAEEYVKLAFETVSLDWRDHVKTDPNLFRPAEPNPLCGDPTKAKNILGWEAETRFNDLVRLMVQSDVQNSIK